MRQTFRNSYSYNSRSLQCVTSCECYNFCALIMFPFTVTLTRVLKWRRPFPSTFNASFFYRRVIEFNHVSFFWQHVKSLEKAFKNGFASSHHVTRIRCGSLEIFLYWVLFRRSKQTLSDSTKFSDTCCVMLLRPSKSSLNIHSCHQQKSQFNSLARRNERYNFIASWLPAHPTAIKTRPFGEWRKFS